MRKLSSCTLCSGQKACIYRLKYTKTHYIGNLEKFPANSKSWTTLKRGGKRTGRRINLSKEDGMKASATCSHNAAVGVGKNRRELGKEEEVVLALQPVFCIHYFNCVSFCIVTVLRRLLDRLCNVCHRHSLNSLLCNCMQARQ